MKPLVLVVDIGNTSTAFGLYCAGRVSRVHRMETARSTPAEISRLVKKIGKDLRIDGVCIASVAPRMNAAWRAAVNHRVVWVDHRKKLGIGVTYPKPATIGADRLANAAGGVAKYGAPLIVADFGTAVTFDVVLPVKGYVGGVIAPGLPLMFSYLAEKTAKLPRIGPGPVKRSVGKSTEDAMRRGAAWGYRGMVREIVGELQKTPGLKRARLCATGGFAKWVVKGLKPAMRVDQDLTLYGIGRIYELNRP
ncbi:MAG: type III pantothenate kinase [bacterium]